MQPTASKHPTASRLAMPTTLTTDENRRAACVRWSWRALPAMVLLGIGLVVGLLTGVIPLCRLVLLGVVPLVGVGTTAAVVILVLFCGTYTKPVRRATSRPASMQRQFGVGPMMLLVTFYAIAFSVLRCFDAPPLSYAFIATFMAAVILGQIFLFHGKQPRKASVVAGLVVGCPAAMAAAYFEFFSGATPGGTPHMVLTVFYAAMHLAFLAGVAGFVAYLLGCVVSGIFLVRRRLDTGSWSLPAEEPIADQPAEWQPGQAVVAAEAPDITRRPGRLRRIVAAIVMISAVLFLTCHCWFAAKSLGCWEILAAIEETGMVGAPKHSCRDSISSQAQWLHDLFSDMRCLVLTQRTFDALRNGRLPRNCLADLGYVDSLLLIDIASLDDADLACLQELTIGGLNASGAMEITEAGLKRLRRLKIRSRLSLELHGPNLHDGDLETLEGIPQLQSLTLAASEVTDAGLKHIGQIPQLATLQIKNPRITDAGLKHLQGLKQLRCLSLHCPQVTGDGLQYLQGLGQLYVLDLSGSSIADANLKHLQRISGLAYLNLESTAITDACVQHLKKLAKLGELRLRDTKLTPAAIKALTAALPQCTVIGPDGVRFPPTSFVPMGPWFQPANPIQPPGVTEQENPKDIEP